MTKKKAVSSNVHHYFLKLCISCIFLTMSSPTTQAITHPVSSSSSHPALGQKSALDRQRHLSNLQKYDSPLPILLPLPPPQTFLSSFLPSFVSPSTSIERPCCGGVYDPLTRSVTVTSKTNVDILFRRGFFGKGTLSRSEPTWRDRRIETLRGGGGMSSSCLSIVD